MEVGGFVGMGYVAQAVGLGSTDASVCAFLCSLTVVSAPIIACSADFRAPLCCIVALYLPGQHLKLENDRRMDACHIIRGFLCFPCLRMKPI